MAKTTDKGNGHELTVSKDDLEFMKSLALDGKKDYGYSDDPADIRIPRIVLLQALSPQVNKRDKENYIEGAEPGAILLQNAPHDPIVKGEVGLLFQPCYHEKMYTEWTPRAAGGGFAGVHRELPLDATRVGEAFQKKFVRKNGNELVWTQYFHGLVHVGEERWNYFIALSNTGMKFAAEFNGILKQRRLPDGETIAKTFQGLYRIKTKAIKGPKGEYFSFVAEPEGFPDKSDQLAGRAVQEDHLAGRAKQIAEMPLGVHNIEYEGEEAPPT